MPDRLDHLESALASVIDALRRVVDGDEDEEVRRKLTEAEKSLMRSVDAASQNAFVISNVTIPPMSADLVRTIVESLRRETAHNQRRRIP